MERDGKGGYERESIKEEGKEGRRRSWRKMRD